MTLPLYVQGSSRARFIKRESTRTEQEPITTHQEPTRNQSQPTRNPSGINWNNAGSTRMRLFIPARDFLRIVLHQPQYYFCLPYGNQGGLHLAYMRRMSYSENSMVVSYYFHLPVQVLYHNE